MKSREKVRLFFENKSIDENYQKLIESSYISMCQSVVPKPDEHSFTLGFICGMEKPTLEKVIELSKLISNFNSLPDDKKDLILLIMDGIKYRNSKLS